MSRRLLCGLLALAATCVAIGERSVYARQCGLIVPPCQTYWESQTVFVGRVRKIAETGGERRVAFDVEQVERGASAPTITVRVPTWELVSRSPLQAGDRYVVYAYGAGDERFIGACGRTRLANEAQEDLAYFREMKAPGSGGIRGVLLDDRGAAFEGELVSAIAAVNAGTSRHVPVERVRTGADGRFEFTPLPRGQYVLVLNLDDRSESAEFNRRAYHPGTRVPGEATIVTVDGPTIVDAGAFRVPPIPSNEPLRALSSGAMGSQLPTPNWYCTARRRRGCRSTRPAASA